MSQKIPKFIFASLLHTFLFLFMFLTIQNSNKKEKINIIFFETILLPNSFTVGTSLIAGSITGCLISFSLFKD